MPQCYIHANLVVTCTLVHEISCTQKSITPMQMPTGSATKIICPLPFGGGHSFLKTQLLAINIECLFANIQVVEQKNPTCPCRKLNPGHFKKLFITSQQKHIIYTLLFLITIYLYSFNSHFYMKECTWVKVFRISPESRILRLTFHRKSASKC